MLIMHYCRCNGCCMPDAVNTHCFIATARTLVALGAQHTNVTAQTQAGDDHGLLF